LENWKLTLDIKAFQDKVSDLQNRFNSVLRNYSLSDKPNYLYDPIRYVLKGKGKRLRPILVYLVGSVYDADDTDLVNAGLAAELLHNFTLVHDDIMDQDDIRHGLLTIHKKWDESTAILAGDGIYALAQLLITDVKVNQLHAVKAFNKATLFVCEGQAYDKEFEHNHSVTLDDYLLMIEKKTGWLIGFCAELGGILGNQDISTIDQLRQYGLNLGNAFQIQDDIFEIIGDDKSMGKSLGSDIVSGKQTILAILARAADPDGWIKTWEKIQKLNLSKSIDYLRNYFLELEVLDKASRLAKQYIEAAKRDLTIIPVDKRDWLKCFTEIVLNRNK
jgi:geranylgeranyl pyrophosphate synthase